MEEQAEQHQKWWQKARKPLGIFGIIVGCILIIALLVVIVMVYLFNVNVPGLRGKTLWDWLQLLIVPLALAVVALVFQLANARTERQIAQQRYEQDKQIAAERYENDQYIALDKQRDDLLQTYLDRMSELLLKENLRTSPSEEVQNVARVRTITVLTQLNARRIGYVFTFLREAGLMSTTSNDNAVSLSHADLYEINWSRAKLIQANLSRANLGGAGLSEAILVRADLSYAHLFQADLSGADLMEANLSYAYLSEANLSRTNLRRADLSGADLSKAKVTEEQLKKAKSLKGATMPDGSIHP
jgi:hypothetical protein